ncbi:hypothetical protein predicted by Glimmer/Critica [Bordetella petrii]|uniref:Uncharacterized protein n=1 Tax=Bordetella petrii (strain ATCC BAA-461 / DSM 12804 / CCUG 43448 / CIP 107267 / Se-1111R) TaxID=340100 RepID=A9I8H7_BORPD|nr:hypothetical protein predicted by Glimmer/Critica [Bordetella petrii]
MNRSNKRMATSLKQRSAAANARALAATGGARKARVGTGCDGTAAVLAVWWGNGGKELAAAYRTLRWQDAADEVSAWILSGSDVDARSTTVAGIGIHRATPYDVNILILRVFWPDNKGFPGFTPMQRHHAMACDAGPLPPPRARRQRAKCHPRYRANNP